MQVSDAASGKPDRRRAVKKLKSLIFTAKSDLQVFRRVLDNTFAVPMLPNGVDCRETSYGGIPCDMLAPQAAASKRFIFYIHGGAFAGGSRRAWRSFCASLAHESASCVCVPEYRLAPTFAYPIGLEDIDGAFRDFCSAEYADGSEPYFFIAADSAGASLACALFQRLPLRFQQYVRGMLFFSPWFDVSDNSAAAHLRHASDELMSAEDIRRSAELYTYRENLQNPCVSPVYMDEKTIESFPPVYIQAGSRELLLPDMKKFRDRFAECGAACTLDIWDDMMYLFQMADEYVPQACQAVCKAGVRIRNGALCAEG